MPNQRKDGKRHIGGWLTAEELKNFEELSKRIGTWDNIENKPELIKYDQRDN